MRHLSRCSTAKYLEMFSTCHAFPADASQTILEFPLLWLSTSYTLKVETQTILYFYNHNIGVFDRVRKGLENSWIKEHTLNI